MANRFPQSLEDTISQYKNQYLADLEDDENDAATLDDIPDDDQSGGRRSTDQDNDEEASSSQETADAEDDNDFALSDSRRGRRAKLPRDLVGLMGQANVSFARGEHNDAIIMCQEVIRQAPRCAEPFISLAEYFNDTDEEEKAEQLYLIAAYLQPSNVDLWVRVAESATRRREFRLAATCYTKAIRANKNESSIGYHLRRCNLYEKLGDQKRALRGYENLISVLGPHDERFGLELSRGIARVYQKEKKIVDCQRTLEGALEKYFDQLSSEDFEQLSYCYNFQKEYIKTIDLSVKRGQISIKINQKEDWSVRNMQTNIENDLKLPLKVDLISRTGPLTLTSRSHLMVAFISLGYFDDTIKPLKTNLDLVDLSAYRQPLYDLAEAYFSKEVYEEAKRILLKLTSQKDIQTGSIWLLYSQCLKNLNEINQAIDAYREVIKIEPNNYDARLVLSNLLSVQGRTNEAIEVTRQPLFSSVPVDIPLLYQSCELLEQSEQWDEFCKSAKALLLTHMTYTKHSREILSMVTSKSFRTRLDNLKSVQREHKIESWTHCQKSVGIKLDSASLLRIFLRYTNLLFHRHRDFTELKRICFSAYTCSAFECYESSIDFYTAVACICSEDREFTYHHLKLLASRNPDNNQLWNLLSMAMNNIYLDLRHGKFCLRQFMKNPDLIPLAVFNGHNALMSGSYKHALAEYMCVFKDRPNDALIAFHLVITYLSLSCQKYVSSKYLCMFQMLAFLHTYLELRGNCQEAFYNIGRVFHQVNMLDKAVIFYKKALAKSDARRMKSFGEHHDEFDEIFDVRREAAFNLALIYKNSQSPRLANKIIREHFTI